MKPPPSIEIPKLPEAVHADPQSDVAKKKLQKTEMEEAVRNLKNADVVARIQAAETLKSLGEKAAPAIDAICRSLMDQSAGMKRATLEAIEKVRPDLYKWTATMLLDGDSAKRANAVVRIGQLGQPAKPLAPVIFDLLKRELAANPGSGSHFNTRESIQRHRPAYWEPCGEEDCQFAVVFHLLHDFGADCSERSRCDSGPYETRRSDNS